MTVSTDQAVRNQQMVMLVLGIAGARALARNQVVIALGLVVVARGAYRQGAATSAAQRRRMAANMTAWRHH